ncbi:MAG: DUF4347 domain-containing protein [Spirulinaceae cyanobacterium]
MNPIEPTSVLPDSGKTAVFSDLLGESQDLPFHRHSGTQSVYLPEVVAAETVNANLYYNSGDPFGINASQQSWGGAVSPETIVFIDGGLADIETLLAGVTPGVEAVVLDPNQDAIAQITEALAGRSNINSLQIISHGSPGELQMGNTRLNTDTLSQYQSHLKAWSDAIAPGGDILLYGCNIAVDESGFALMNALGQLTGADIAASSDLTGSSLLGGDWDLEVVTGSIESNLSLYLWAQSAYDAVLATVTDLQVNSASYLGGTGDDAAAAVEIAPDNTVLMAGTINNQGQITRLDGSGQNVLATYTVGSNIADMDVNRVNGNITAIGDSGVTTLKSDGTVLWSASLTGANNTRRVAVAQDGTVAILESNNSYNNKVTVFSAAGAQLGSFSLNSAKSADDIAIDSQNQSVFVAGFRQVASDLQLPLFNSYSYTGNVKWSNYNFSESEAVNKGDTADTRGLRVAMGRDGMLYYAGSLDGGTTVYRRNPQDINQNATHNVDIDNYTNTSNSGVGKYGYFARVNPATGETLKGQYVVNRLSSGKGNSFGINAITASETGEVLIGGSSAATVKHRDSLKINGTAVGNYTMGEGAAIAVSSDFTSRELVAVWAGNGTVAASGINGVAAANGLRAIASTVSGSMITVNATQGAIAGGKDAYFSVWGNTTTPSLSINDISVTEGDSGTLNAVFTVSLSHAPQGNVTVDYATADNTATAGNDYTAKNGTLTFTPTGSLIQTLEIPITGDTTRESLESFYLNLSNANNAIIADNQGVASIIDNDSNAPTDITLSQLEIPENTAVETVIGTLSSTDLDAGDTHTYTLIDNAGGRFKIVGNEVRVNNSTLLDFESQSSHTIKIRTTDAAGLTFDKNLMITLTDINENPVATTPSNVVINDVAATPTTTVNLATNITDPDAGDTLTYSIVSNSNSSLFSTPPTLDPDTGKLVLDYAPDATGVSEIKVRATDKSGLTVETTLKVEVKPTSTTNSSTNPSEAATNSDISTANSTPAATPNLTQASPNSPTTTSDSSINSSNFELLPNNAPGLPNTNSDPILPEFVLPPLEPSQSLFQPATVPSYQLKLETQADRNIFGNSKIIAPLPSLDLAAINSENLLNYLSFDSQNTDPFFPGQVVSELLYQNFKNNQTIPLTTATVETGSSENLLSQLFNNFRISNIDGFNGIALATAAFLLTGTLGTYDATLLPKMNVKQKKPPKKNDDDFDDFQDRSQEFAGWEVNEQTEDELPLFLDSPEQQMFKS